MTGGGPRVIVVQVYGPATACLWDEDWDKLDEAEQGARRPWQGAIVSCTCLLSP